MNLYGQAWEVGKLELHATYMALIYKFETYNKTKGKEIANNYDKYDPSVKVWYGEQWLTDWEPKTRDGQKELVFGYEYRLVYRHTSP